MLEMRRHRTDGEPALPLVERHQTAAVNRPAQLTRSRARGIARDLHEQIPGRRSRIEPLTAGARAESRG
jgi:hypothetical protein